VFGIHQEVVFIQLFRVDAVGVGIHGERPDLQDIEGGPVVVAGVVFQVDGKFDFDWNTQRDLPDFQQFFHDFRQREVVILEDPREGQHLHAFFVEVVREAIVFVIPHRGHIFEHVMALRLPEIELHQRDFLAFGEVKVVHTQIQRVKLFLGGAHHLLLGQHFRLGITRTEAMVELAFHHRFSQAEGDVGDPVRVLHIAGGIEVVGLRHAGDVGIVIVLALHAAHRLLDDHRHFLFFGFEVQGFQKVAGVAQIHRGEHQLDGVHQLAQAEHLVHVIVGQHKGAIDSRQRLGLGILQQTGRAYRDGIGHMVQIDLKAVHQLLGELSADEDGVDFLIRLALHLFHDVVAFHKAVKLVGADDGCGGQGNGDVFKLLFKFHRAEQRVQEGQSASLAAQRAFREPDDLIHLAEGDGVEVDDLAAVFIDADGAEDVMEIVAQLIPTAKVLHLHRPDFLGDLHFSVGDQPV